MTLDDEVSADVGVAGVEGHQAQERARGMAVEQPGVKHVKACIQASSKAFRFVSHRVRPDSKPSTHMLPDREGEGWAA